MKIIIFARSDPDKSLKNFNTNKGIPLFFSSILLKVPSGQIGSTWEWYHWKALEKYINHNMFLIFYFWSWIFDKSSKFWAASCKNESNLLLVRFTVCIESCLPIGWRTVIWWKNPPKCSSILVWVAEWWKFLLASRNPKKNWCLSRIEYGLA